MTRSKKASRSDPCWAPVPAAVLDHFAPPGLLEAADVEAATQRFKKALLERALGAELQHHLAQEAGGALADAPANHRNGTTPKTVLTDDGAVPLAIPRDRHGTFAPQRIPKHARRFTGFDDKIIARYARGLTVREIQAFLREMYTIDVSPDLISSVTDAIMSEVTAWQTRPLAAMYPVVFFDALRVKMRDEAVVHTKAVYLALTVLPDGTRDILGVWIEQTEGAKFCPWGAQFPTIAASWKRAWTQVIPFFAFPPEVRRVIYTTNALETVNGQLRKILKTRGPFPTEDAATKLIWLALRNITATWTRAAPTGKTAMNPFAILYGDRFTQHQA